MPLQNKPTELSVAQKRPVHAAHTLCHSAGGHDCWHAPEVTYHALASMPDTALCTSPPIWCSCSLPRREHYQDIVRWLAEIVPVIVQEYEYHAVQARRLAEHLITLESVVVWVDYNPTSFGVHGKPILQCLLHLNSVAHMQVSFNLLSWFNYSENAGLPT